MKQESVWIVLKEFPSEQEAEIIKGLLISEGIAARVTCDNAGGLYSGFSFAFASAKVYVQGKEKDKALKLISEEL